MKKFCLFLAFLLIFTLAGCGGEQEVQTPDTPAPAEITLDTCALTSHSWVIEVETGYYARFGRLLCYADKSDLSNWVPVCNDPGCSHSNDSCPAHSLSEYFYENGRLYSLRNDLDFGTKVDAYAVYSMNPDGTDLKQEYVIEETNMANGGGLSELVCDDAIYLATSALQNDGTYRNLLIRAYDDGYQILSENTTDSMAFTHIYPAHYLYGDLTLKSAVIGTGKDGTPTSWRVEGNSLEEIPDINEYECDDGYLSGNLLYYFLKDNGYYITDLSTGESWKWMDAQLSDSRAVQFNGQYIVETNISPNAKPENPQLRVYDGEIWHEVTCPEGLRTDDITGFYILALSTEYIFIQVSYPDSGSGGDVYCISYADGSYAVQYCGSFE